MKTLFLLLALSSGALGQAPFAPTFSAAPVPSSRIFTLIYTDANGAADLWQLHFWFTPSGSGANACYGMFLNNLIYLADDSGNILANPGLAPGTNATLSNSQCSISVSGFNAVTAGASIALTVPIRFANSFSGMKTILMNAYDTEDNSAGIHTAGTYCVNSCAPTFTQEYESPTGTLGIVNGTNPIFLLANPPAAPPQVFLDGLKQRPGVDYTIAGQTITFLTAPAAGMYVEVDYWR